MRRTRHAALAALLTVTFTASPALADTGPPPTPPPGKTVTGVTTYSASQITTARSTSRTLAAKKGLRGISAEAQATQNREKSAFVAEAAKGGVTYSTDQVDVIDLGKVKLDVPNDVDIEQITVTEYNDGTVAADVVDSPVPPAGEAAAVDPPSSGKGTSAAPAEERTAYGTYKLTLLDAGAMWAKWERWVVKNDGHPSYNYYATKRHAYTQGLPKTPPDVEWSTTGIFIKSYPKPGYEDVFLDTDDFAPARDNGGCGQVEAIIAMGPITVGFSLPLSCENYDVTRSGAGTFSNYYTQGPIFWPGNRDASYVHSVIVPQGAEVRWSYNQRLEMAKWTYPSKKCDSTNSNKVCEP